ncbi:transient receptor potential cation channel subfamily V member 5-like [Protopterus annectens]|uniref:transient receptor potential cation channel subfamily V member 5-like n=1 Tax=Protopterus annectens TaxID=7888 RepID=UPI001CFA2443|nr:transient receptor potential cation channel subfamily V member 5-like [Protopterus annectens]
MSQNPVSSKAEGILCRSWRKMYFGWKKINERKQERDLLYMRQQKRIAETPLFKAAKENDIHTLKMLLECSTTDPFIRGALGETALHIAAQFNSYEAALVLLNTVPDLINEPMKSELYNGQTALHIAVVNKNVNLVKQLLQMGADAITPRATGTFFQRSPGNIIYYGEHVLSFAACAGNEEIVRLIIQEGACITTKDSLGNTVFHILVLQPNKNSSSVMYDILMAYDKKENGIPADQIPNNEGLTPFKLSAKEGNLVMFQHLLQKMKQVQWSYGSLNSTLYDITEIDTCGHDFSVLELVLTTEKKEAHHIIDMTPVKELVGLKWHQHGKHYFRLFCILYLIYISLFTACCINRPLMPRTDNATDPSDLTIFVKRPLQECYKTKEDYTRLVGEIISVIGAVLIILIEVPDVLRFGMKIYFWKSPIGGPFHCIGMCYACLVLITLILRLTSTEGEDVSMSMALVLGWMYTLYFARGFKLLGPYAIMIHKILFTDVIQFIWIMVFITLGYTAAFQVIFATQNPTGIPAFAYFSMALQSTYYLFLNVLNVPTNYQMTLPNMYVITYTTFALLCPVVLLNLLIAMMADTYFRVMKAQEQLWRVQVVATTVLLERKMPKFLWPRTGICGKEYGLGDHWYLRIEEKKDLSVNNIRPYVEAISNSQSSIKAKEKLSESPSQNSQLSKTFSISQSGNGNVPESQSVTIPDCQGTSELKVTNLNYSQPPNVNLKVPQNLTRKGAKRNFSRGWEVIRLATVNKTLWESNSKNEEVVYHI